MYIKSIPFVVSHLKELRVFAQVRKEIRNKETIEDFHQLQAEMMGEALGLTSKEAARLVEDLFYTQWFEVFNRLKPFNHVTETLESFQKAGLKLAAMSDFPLKDRLKKLGLEDFFPVRFSSEEVGYLKPRPESFQELVKRLEVPGENILYVGNSYSYDVVGAQKANLKAAHLVRKPETHSEADFSFFGYKKLEKWVLGQIQ